jgi:hypothetical protein
MRVKLLDDSPEISISELQITTNPTTPYYNPSPDHLHESEMMEVEAPELILTDQRVEEEFQESNIAPMAEQDGTEHQTMSAIPTALAPPAPQLSEVELAHVRGLFVTVQTQAFTVQAQAEDPNSLPQEDSRGRTFSSQEA